MGISHKQTADTVLSHSGVTPKKYLAEILPMVRALGNTSSHLLCVEREVTEGKNIHRAEGGVKWLN